MAAIDNETASIEPSDWDVLYGRSDYSLYHIGNVSFRTLIGYCLNDYESIPNTKRSMKTQFFRDIVDMIKRSGGRFLKRDNNGGWSEVTLESARKKVGQELRDESKKPRILEKYSLVKTACMEPYFKSASDFDWFHIVTACKQEITGCRYPTEEEYSLEKFFFDVLAPPSGICMETLRSA